MDTLKKAMIEALKKSLGRVTDATRAVDIARSTHYLWMETDPEYKAAVAELNEIALDHVESKLFELINGAEYQAVSEGAVLTLKDAPNPTACIFYLKTKGKARGYVERQEITGAENGPVKVVISDHI